MGLFGALFAGVSGLDSQSNKIGIISNNISNVNTVGYKQTSGLFNTLVVPSGSGGSFSPGGVLGLARQLIDKQGLIQGTASPTDIAISGGGLMVVNDIADGSGQVLFTRAGSFGQDALGNFVNTNGYFLQGWPLDADGNIPSNSANFSSLTTVNIRNNTSGAATATSSISLAANLNAAQSVLLGPGQTVSMDANSTNNYGITSTQLIVSNEFGAASTNGIVRGDTFTVTSNGTTTSTFTYGGVSIGRNVASALTAGEGDGGFTLEPDESISAGSMASNTSGQITISVADASLYTVNSTMYLSDFSSSVGGITVDQINGPRVITARNTSTNTITIQTGATSSSAATGAGSTGTITNRTFDFAGNILDATTTTATFLGTSGTAAFVANALNFRITLSSGDIHTFRYTSTAPDVTNGQFNSLTTLANAINNTSGLSARIVSGRIYIGATDASLGLTFTNGDAAGSPDDGLSGIDWVSELDLPSTSITNVNAAAASTEKRFNSLASLDTVIDADANLTGTLSNPLGSSRLGINNSNPEETIRFTDGSGNTGSLLTEFGFDDLTGSPLTTGTIAGTYAASDPTKNMSSGEVTPQFTRDITIYDSLGNSHVVAFNVVKLATNRWGVEITAVPITDATTSNSDGQLASGEITFSGDGTLLSVSAGLTNPITVQWATSGASASVLSLDLGTIGETDGLSQYSAAFNVSLADQNGSSVGQLSGISIDADGYVVASFSNGQTQRKYKIPLAQVNNPNGLLAVSGGAYIQTEASGVANLEEPGSNGTGKFATSALEQSNVDLSEQLTNLIVAQQAYGANTRVLSITSQLLQQLDQIVQ